MLAFVRGEHDCLVATTIIESGLDIPTANTLLVERSDQLGLAQAYQIRGRVGRSRERAYAYLLYPSAETLTHDAAARLATLSDNTELGSGFRVAMRDLEIRGAGTCSATSSPVTSRRLGSSSTARCSRTPPRSSGPAQPLCEGAPQPKARRDPFMRSREPVRIDVDVDAYVPADYIPFEAAKIDVHRRIAAAREPGELRALREELEDRFGPVPESVSNLLELQRARIALGEAGARSVEFRAGRLRVSPVELSSEQVSALNERVPEAIYQWRERTIAVPVPEDAGARLGAILALADGLGAAAAAPAPA